MKSKTLIPIALVLVLIPAAGAQDLARHPGYADLSSFERVLGDQVSFNVDFDRESLAALLQLAGSEDERLTSLVDSVESVRARLFQLDPGEQEAVLQGLSDTVDQLKLAGWSTLVSVRDEGEQFEVFLRLRDDRIAGVAALFYDSGEAGWANVVGDISMADVMALAPSVSALRGVLGEIKDAGSADAGSVDG